MAACELVREHGWGDLRISKYIETETELNRVEVISYVHADAFSE